MNTLQPDFGAWTCLRFMAIFISDHFRVSFHLNFFFDQWLNFKAIGNILNSIKNAYGLSGMADEYFNCIYVSCFCEIKSRSTPICIFKIRVLTKNEAKFQSQKWPKVNNSSHNNIYSNYYSPKIFMDVAILVAGAPQSCGAMRGNAPQIAGRCLATPKYCGAPTKNILIFIKSRKSVFCGEKTHFYV